MSSPDTAALPTVEDAVALGLTRDEYALVVEKLERFAAHGGLMLGICNGFQVLCEAGLLPGALLPNLSLRFVCRQVEVEVQRSRSKWMRDARPGERLSIPAKHTTGRYWAPEPVSTSTACSGCGIRPTTLPALFDTPATSRAEPLKLCPAAYLRTIWPLASISSSTGSDA